MKIFGKITAIIFALFGLVWLRILYTPLAFFISIIIKDGKDNIGIIGGADTPTFTFLFSYVLILLLAIVIILFSVFNIIRCFKCHPQKLINIFTVALFIALFVICFITPTQSYILGFYSMFSYISLTVRLVMSHLFTYSSVAVVIVSGFTVIYSLIKSKRELY